MTAETMRVAPFGQSSPTEAGPPTRPPAAGLRPAAAVIAGVDRTPAYLESLGASRGGGLLPLASGGAWPALPDREPGWRYDRLHVSLGGLCPSFLRAHTQRGQGTVSE